MIGSLGCDNPCRIWSQAERRKVFRNHLSDNPPLPCFGCRSRTACSRVQSALHNTFINGAGVYASIIAYILRKKHIQAYLFWLFNIITALNNQLFNILLYTENSLYTDLIQQFIKSLLHMGVVPLYPWTLAYRIVIYQQKKKERFFWWKQRSQPNFQLRKRWLISRYFKSCLENNCIISFIIYCFILIIYIFYTNIYKFSIEDNCKIVLLFYNYFQNSSLVFRLKIFFNK